jgi:hypothetical protein
MTSISSLKNIYIPIETEHKGPIVKRFPSNPTEEKAYRLSQQILAKEAGPNSTKFPQELDECEKNVYITEMPEELSKQSCEQVANAKRGRSLNARVTLPPKTPLCAFKGKILNQDEFNETVPVQSAGVIVKLPKRSIAKDCSPDANSNDFIIRDNPEMRKRDLSNLCCKLLSRNKKNNTVKVSLYGFRVSHHMLSMGNGSYICPSIKVKNTHSELPFLKKKHEYIWGLGTIANTDDPPFGVGDKHNAELYVTLSPPAAVLVSKKEIKQDEEIFTSYDSKNFVVFKNSDDLWNALRVSKKSPTKKRHQLS